MKRISLADGIKKGEAGGVRFVTSFAGLAFLEATGIQILTAVS